MGGCVSLLIRITDYLDDLATALTLIIERYGAVLALGERNGGIIHFLCIIACRVSLDDGVVA